MSKLNLKILIVEDNFAFSLELERLVEEIGYEVLGTADNSAEALEMIFSKDPDVILMDIDIKGSLTGTQIGEKIKHLNIPIIFITSFNDEKHYGEAQNANMVGYLIKPVQKLTLKSTLELALRKTHLGKEEAPNVEEKEEDFLSKELLFFKKKGVYHKVDLKSIVLISTNDNYAEILLDNGSQFVTRITVSKMEELLPADVFMRVHRQHIARLDKIESIDLLIFKMVVGGKTIPFSRSKKDVLKEKARFFS